MEAPTAGSVLQLCELVQDVSTACGLAIYLVGGYVRDLARGQVSIDADVDLMVAGDARIVARAVAERLGAMLTTHDRFLTANVRGLTAFGALSEVDFASARTEIYPSPGSLPEVQLAPVEKDLQRRDFTINAMALELGLFSRALRAGSSIRPLLTDPFGGLRDLDLGVLRVLHAQSFFDDPTRIFRGVRYATRLGFGFERDTEDLARRAINGGALATISSTRWVNELRLLIRESQLGEAFGLLGRLGALRMIPGFRVERAIEIVRIASRMTLLGPAAQVLPPLEALFLLFLTTVEPAARDAFMAALALRKVRGNALLKLIQTPLPGDLREADAELLFIHGCGIGQPESDVALQALRSRGSR